MLFFGVDAGLLALGLLFMLPALVRLWGVVFRPHLYGHQYILSFTGLVLLLFAALGVALIVTAL